MNSHQTPVFALPSHPQRTLIIARRFGSGLLLFLVLAGGWRLAINQSEAEGLRQRTKASLSRSVITVRSKPAEASRKIVLPAGLRGGTETQLYARSNGYLSAWYKTIGDQVKKGELLALIDVPELEQELAQA
ncbi:MAG: efflux RND transporter periplasmic adaptor subunit, partial [Methylobacter sp.]